MNDGTYRHTGPEDPTNVRWWCGRKMRYHVITTHTSRISAVTVIIIIIITSRVIIITSRHIAIRHSGDDITTHLYDFKKVAAGCARGNGNNNNVTQPLYHVQHPSIQREQHTASKRAMLPAMLTHTYTYIHTKSLLYIAYSIYIYSIYIAYMYHVPERPGET